MLLPLAVIRTVFRCLAVSSHINLLLLTAAATAAFFASATEEEDAADYDDDDDPTDWLLDPVSGALNHEDDEVNAC